MTFQVEAGPPARPRDEAVASSQLHLTRDELTRVRTAALAWRNGMGAILAGLVGFGLIKGRTDVGELASPYNLVVGVFLGFALLIGGVAAALLMRAAHGRPTSIPLREVATRGFEDPRLISRMMEADSAVRALRNGVALAFSCAALLCVAVGTTWYGPAKEDPQLEITLDSGTSVCGEADTVTAGRLILKTSSGALTVDLARAVGLHPVTNCRASTTGK
jgi:hypothetical protein